MKPLEFDILVTGKNAIWGIDENINDAKLRCKRAGGKPPYKCFVIPKGAELDGLTIVYPANSAFCITKIGTM